MKTVEIPNVSTRVKTTNEECKRVGKALKLSGYICSFVRLIVVTHQYRREIVGKANPQTNR